jgi:hypothetical protein
LSVVQDIAREQGWATSHIECKVDGVQIDRFETLYPQIVKKLKPPGVVDGPYGEITPHPMRSILERWARNQTRRAGIREGGLTRPFDADARVHSILEAGLLRSSLPPDFLRALTAFARAYVLQDTETMGATTAWITGANEKTVLPSHYIQRPTGVGKRDTSFQLRPIGKGTARDAMRGLLWLIRSAEYAGLVLCIDEIEELAKLGNRKRQDQALQALREFVDHAGGEGGFQNLCMYLAATPDMFEGENYFPRYDALATRIQAVSTEINWRGPVIDLDRTPLNASELRLMVARIRDVYRVAYDQESRIEVLDDTSLQALITSVMDTRFRIAKPRLLARIVVDLLERSRQGRSEATPDFGSLVGVAAANMAKEAGG